MTAQDFLKILHVPQCCVHAGKDAQENGRRFRILAPNDAIVLRTHVDGCWVDNNYEKRVDYLFCIENLKELKMLILVELKGGDYRHALKQINDTMELLNKFPKASVSLLQKKAGIVLSHGNQVGLYQNEAARIMKKHKILIIPKSQYLELRL